MTKEHFQPAINIEVVDLTHRGTNTYLVVLTSAPSNCNVQGQCGASRGESTLVWLKLAADLKPAEIQSNNFDSCTSDRYARIQAVEDVDPIKAKDLHWKGDLLQIDYENRLEHLVWRVTYDRQDPDAGLRQVLVP